MSFAGVDFQFVGSAYDAPDPTQDVQASINYYVEMSQDEKSKTPVAMLGTPGLTQLLEFDTVGPVRGCWVLPGGTQAVFVVGSSTYLVSMTVPATQTSIAQFTYLTIGQLLSTNTGPVCIRDNGAGNYVCIVDGPYGYLYNRITGLFTQILDPAFLGADRVAFIDGWLIFNQPGTQNFYTTAPTPYTVTFNGSFFAKNDSSSDNIVTLMENNRELWLIGERHTEIWFDGGGAQFAFQRIPGAAPPIGCSAKHSIARMGDSLVWLGKNEAGENIVVQTQGYSWGRISQHGIEKAISSYPLISDAIGYTYEEEGHLFYMLTFPTADKTWCYDASTKKWHERASYDTNLGVFHRHRSNCFANFQNIRMVGDYQSPKLYQMTRKTFTDNGAPLVALRRCSHIWSREDRQRVFHASLQIEFTPGVGLQTGQGTDPQAMLRWSNDGGQNYGTERWRTIGKAGRTKNRAMWRRLGSARDRVYELRFSDPTNRDIVGATLYAEGSE